jgi:hypothetical protein
MASSSYHSSVAIGDRHSASCDSSQEIIRCERWCCSITARSFKRQRVTSQLLLSGSGVAPSELASDGISISPARDSSASILQTPLACGYARFTSDGSLVLYQTPPDKPSSAQPIWSSLPRASSSDASQPEDAPQAAKSAAKFALQLAADGMLTTFAVGYKQHIMWTNAISLPFSGPFKLQLICNGSHPVLLETDASNTTVWRSDVSPDAQASAPPPANTETLQDLSPNDPIDIPSRLDPTLRTISLPSTTPSPSPTTATRAPPSSKPFKRIQPPKPLLVSEQQVAPSGPSPPSRPLSQWPAGPVPQPPNTPPKQMVYLDNGVLRVGFDLNMGAALSFLATHPAFDTNLINNWDTGRLVQQSYYGSRDNSSWLAHDVEIRWK